MKVESMRLLDRWAGVPLTAMLTGVRRIGDVMRRPGTGAPRRILIVKLVEQGATVVAEPALRRAVELVGRDNVFIAVFTNNRFILDVLDVIPPENVITLRDSKLLATAVDTLRALRRTRREKIDTAIDFECFSRFSGALTYLSGASRRVGLHSFGGEAGYRGDLMTHRVAYNITMHASEIYSLLMEAATTSPAQLPAIDKPITVGELLSRFQPTPDEVEIVRTIVRRVIGREEIAPMMLFNANSSDILPLRRWARKRYIELARRVLGHYPELVIAFTGSPEEQQEANDIASEVGSERCFSVAGQTTLRQLLILYGLADVLVTNDSGPAHFASLTPIDVVTLFGPETPAVFGAKTPRNHVIYANLACSPCVNAFNQRYTACKRNLCMEHILVDRVFEIVCHTFESRRNVIDLPTAAPRIRIEKQRAN
jgi:ADP-heptose:LPS heptosyltransferase